MKRAAGTVTAEVLRGAWLQTRLGPRRLDERSSWHGFVEQVPNPMLTIARQAN